MIKQRIIEPFNDWRGRYVGVLIGGLFTVAVGPLIGMWITGVPGLYGNNYHVVIGVRLFLELSWTFVISYYCEWMWDGAELTTRRGRITTVAVMGLILSSLPLLDFISGPRSVSGTILNHNYVSGHGGTRYSGGSRFASFSLKIKTADPKPLSFWTMGFSGDHWLNRWSDAKCEDGKFIEVKYSRFMGFPVELHCTDIASAYPLIVDQAFALMDKTDYSVAIPLLDRAIAMRGEFARTAIYLRGICRVMMGNPTEGCVDVRKAVEMPDYSKPIRDYIHDDAICFPDPKTAPHGK